MGACRILDHLFFALAIAIKSYFRKIADPGDIAATAGVSFTINHIAAVTMPWMLGLIRSPTRAGAWRCFWSAPRWPRFRWVCRA